MKRTPQRLGAGAAVALLALLSAAPAQAATVAQARATAISGSLGGTPVQPGAVSATHDGTDQHLSGAAHPPISVGKNQSLLNLGVLAQDARARTLPDGTGESMACAGVAGNGGSVASIGDSACLTPGDPVDVTVAGLDLSGADLIDPESALAPLEPLNQLGEAVFSQVLGAVSEALSQAGVVLEIGGTLGSAEARCVAGVGHASGSTTLLGASLGARVGFGETVEEFELIRLPVDPEPNTDLLLDLDSVVAGVLDGLQTQLTRGLRGALEPLNMVLGPVRDQVVDTLLAQVAPQLQPLSENLARIVLNRQDRPHPDQITVTALSVEPLPAAREFGIDTPGELRIGEVGCGPNGRYRAPVRDEPRDQPDRGTPDRPAEDLPEVPTTVASGVAAGGGRGGSGLPGGLSGGVLALLALGVLASAARLLPDRAPRAR